MTEAHEPYRPEVIEPKAQGLWEKLDVFRAGADGAGDRQRLYCLDMFPYPSGEGLHVGHVEGYTATDIYSRYQRMQGRDVLHPMGWDAFGLPAENTAIKQRTQPRALVGVNVERFRRQLKRLGFSYDWSRELNTTDPAYYRWTQWIFLKLFHLGLAYEAVVPINWCPSCKTGLANEEVVDGACERCGTRVEKKNLRQWMLRITKYADRLLKDLDALDWPEGIKELQRNWIGRSDGTEVTFGVAGSDKKISVFTTRADTLFGATYLVLAPEHPLVEDVTTPEHRDAVRRYVEAARAKSDIERAAEGKEKTGVDTGARAVNPMNGEEIPLWVADYVLASYGTGAVMAVPAHDARDFAFAKRFKLLIREVMRPRDVIASEAKQSPRSGSSERIASSPRVREDPRNDSEVGRAFTDDGVLVNSGAFSGLISVEAREKITAWLTERGQGGSSVQYKLRDWVFSRQRYWGEPIPVVHCARCGIVPVPEEQLPVLLPEVGRYEPTGTGESPLAAITEWVQTACPQCGGPATRETNTMPQWAGSCWYFLRFADPRNDRAPWSWDALERWLPVNLYVGGAEHAVLHLLYARFWVKALFDGGYLPLEEPFQKLRNQGTILGPDGQKMSKSRGNVITPDEVVEKYGADTLRVYEMFLGPLEAGKPWNPRTVNGAYRFLYRVWRLQEHLAAGESENARQRLHALVKKVGFDIERLKFHTALAAMMAFLNLAEQEGVTKDSFRTFLLLLSPFAPHLAEELWQRAADGGNAGSVTQAPWPVYDETFLKEETVTLVVQVDGRRRDQLYVPCGLSDAEAAQQARTSEKIAARLAGKTVKNVIVVPDRLVNFVTR